MGWALSGLGLEGFTDLDLGAGADPSDFRNLTAPRGKGGGLAGRRRGVSAEGRVRACESHP